MNTITSEVLHSKKLLALAVWGLIGILGFLFISYAYLVNKTVLNVVAREKAESTIGSLNTTLGQMEFQEMSMRGADTIDLAHSLGFQDVDDITFINQQPVSKGLSYNNHVE
jgi:hypothetical protein